LHLLFDLDGLVRVGQVGPPCLHHFGPVQNDPQEVALAADVVPPPGLLLGQVHALLGLVGDGGLHEFDELVTACFFLEQVVFSYVFDVQIDATG